MGDEIETVIKTCRSQLTFGLRVAGESLIFHFNEAGDSLQYWDSQSGTSKKIDAKVVSFKHWIDIE